MAFPTGRRIHPFWYYLCYFLCLSLVGFLLLKFIPARNRSTDLDLFFTVVSALTATGLGTVDMESFSNGQLLALTILILVGAEIFTSMLALGLMRIKRRQEQARPGRAEDPPEDTVGGEVELGFGMRSVGVGSDVRAAITTTGAIWPVDTSPSQEGDTTPSVPHERVSLDGSSRDQESAARYLLFVVMGYYLFLLLLGFLSVLAYLLLFPSAGDVLRSKRIRLPTFSIFVTASTFANCGFVPNNEGMVAFQNNSGMLLLLSPLVLAGNTLFPPTLRLLLWTQRKFLPASRVGVLDFLLKDGGGEAVKYPHLLSARICRWLAATVVGFLLVQTALLSAMEWRPSGTLSGMRGSYRKVVGAWFQSLNTRHSGENVIDVSSIAPAVLVLYLVMMYLPARTSLLPSDGKSISSMTTERRKRRTLWDTLHLSHISYLSVFVILICITERKNMSNDPRNFGAFNIIFEVVSAYGNVGLSTGYSCQRLLTPDPSCQSPSYSFVGVWSTKGKLLLVVVMLFGRLKRFTTGGGKAWKLG